MASRRLTLIVALLALPALAACGASKASGATAGAPAPIALEATDTACNVATTTVPAGPLTLHVTNKGSKTTEVYVYGADAGAFTKVVGEVENIGPGTSRDVTATLTDATYEVACKPGMTGDGIRTKLTVTGGSAAAASPSTSASADRTVLLTTDGTAITGLPASAKTGENIQFTLTNNAGGSRALELKDPSGAVAGASSEIAAGGTGTLMVRLTKPGIWDVNVEGTGIPDVTVHLTVG
ncbi:MAG: iron uptake system component EfeO [Frankiaceae bacterium]|jgi:uncharacterized cupredoxin-like copper-binding protein|nr:iron uptake system component EfeO [Frankiaceae bacterium]